MYDSQVMFATAFAGGIALFAGGMVFRAGHARRLWREIDRRCKLQCVGCGYDIRASVDRCPECGHPLNRHASRGG